MLNLTHSHVAEDLPGICQVQLSSSASSDIVGVPGQSSGLAPLTQHKGIRPYRVVLCVCVCSRVNRLALSVSVDKIEYRALDTLIHFRENFLLECQVSYSRKSQKTASHRSIQCHMISVEIDMQPSGTTMTHTLTDKFRAWAIFFGSVVLVKILEKNSRPVFGHFHVCTVACVQRQEHLLA